MRFPVRTTVVLTLLIMCAAIRSTAGAQQAAPSATSSQAVSIMMKAAAALQGSNSVSDVTLSATVRKIVGPNDLSGTAVLKTVGLNSSVVVTLPSGVWSETRTETNGQPAGSWSGADGLSHAISPHNLFSDPSWFFPTLPILRGMSSGYAPQYIGRETRDGQAVEHVSISQIIAVPSHAGAPTFAHLSQVDLFLDSVTFLPMALIYNTHPDDNALIDIPIEVRFSDFRAVSGAQVPFHIEKFLNNVLAFDLQVNTATLNSGLTASQIQQ